MDVIVLLLNGGRYEIIEEKHVKRRKLGAGAKKKLDSSDEENVAKAIEQDSVAHGRRHDIVLYTNHTVCKRDFLSLANYFRFQKGKCLIKSCTTVYNRGKPENKRNRQAKLHIACIGKGLFCVQKPPKTIVEDNESTHYQRALKKNWLWDMNNVPQKFTINIAEDDKANLRPGTSIGVEKARNLAYFSQLQILKLCLSMILQIQKLL